MKKIFEPVSLGNISTDKRIIRSATLESSESDSTITPFYKKLYEDMADGGVNLIITGMMGVGHNSCSRASMARIDNNSFVSNFKEITNSIHSKGSKIIVQVCHCGYKSTMIDKGEYSLSASDFDSAKEMSWEEIQNVVKDFGIASGKCKEAGADGVQIHGAHGYLINQFLSPYINKRTDEYGGNIENRARLLFEIYDEIRKVVGKEYPVWIKINYTDLIEGGLTGDESAWVCKELDKKGIDVIEVSSGISIDMKTIAIKPGKTDEGHFAEGALRIASEVAVPVISVGGYRTPEAIENFLNKGNIVAISLCRPFIKEPGLLNRWQSGDRSKSKCISCNKCFNPKGLRCYAGI